MKGKKSEKKKESRNERKSKTNIERKERRKYNTAGRNDMRKKVMDG